MVYLHSQFLLCNLSYIFSQKVINFSYIFKCNNAYLVILLLNKIFTTSIKFPIFLSVFFSLLIFFPCLQKSVFAKLVVLLFLSIFTLYIINFYCYCLLLFSPIFHISQLFSLSLSLNLLLVPSERDLWPEVSAHYFFLQINLFCCSTYTVTFLFQSWYFISFLFLKSNCFLFGIFQFSYILLTMFIMFLLYSCYFSVLVLLLLVKEWYSLSFIFSVCISLVSPTFCI